LTPTALAQAATLYGLGVPPLAAEILSAAVVVLGLAAAFASVMIYVDTHRYNWRLSVTWAEFGGTVTLLGASLATAAMALAEQPTTIPAATWIGTLALLLGVDLYRTRTAASPDPEAQ